MVALNHHDWELGSKRLYLVHKDVPLCGKAPVTAQAQSDPDMHQTAPQPQ